MSLPVNFWIKIVILGYSKVFSLKSADPHISHPLSSAPATLTFQSFGEMGQMGLWLLPAHSCQACAVPNSRGNISSQLEEHQQKKQASSGEQQETHWSSFSHGL